MAVVWDDIMAMCMERCQITTQYVCLIPLVCSFFVPCMSFVMCVSSSGKLYAIITITTIHMDLRVICLIVLVGEVNVSLHFADDILMCTFWSLNPCWISIAISLRFIPKGVLTSRFISWFTCVWIHTHGAFVATNLILHMLGPLLLTWINFNSRMDK